MQAIQGACVSNRVQQQLEVSNRIFQNFLRQRKSFRNTRQQTYEPPLGETQPWRLCHARANEYGSAGLHTFPIQLKLLFARTAPGRSAVN